MASFEAVKRLGLETPWDIEDLVLLGKQIEACPYFAARSLMSDAEIIMCPYNYVIDPKIREKVSVASLHHSAMKYSEPARARRNCVFLCVFTIKRCLLKEIFLRSLVYIWKIRRVSFFLDSQ